jgi:hypothetical protein
MDESNNTVRTFAERNWRPILAAIILLAAGLRLYGLGRFSIWYDESTSIFALQYVDWDLRFLRADETRLIPLNTLFLYFWYTIVKSLPGVTLGSQASDFLLHGLPGTFSVLTVPLVFALGRRVTGRPAAGLSAASLTAISPFHLYYASELGPHSLYAITVLLAMYCNYRALEENRLRHWIGTVVFEALAFYAYYFSVFYLAAVNLFVLMYLRTYRPVLARWIVSQGAAALLVLPAIVLAAFVFQMHASAAAHWFPYPTLRTLVFTVKDWFAGYSPQPAVYWPLLALGAIAFVLGAAALRDRPRALAFLAIAAFLPPFIQYVFWNTQNFAFYTMRIQLAYSLPAFVLAGAGLTGWPFRGARLAMLAALAGLSVPAIADHYAQRIHPVFEHRMGVRYKVDNRGAAEFIRANWREGDVVAHASTVTLGPFLYHYLDAPQAFAVLGPEEWEAHLENYPDEKVWESLGFLPERVDDFVRGAPRAWLVSAGWEPEELFAHGILLRAWLDAHGVRLLERHDGEVDVYLFDLSAQTPVDRVADLGWYTKMQPSAVSTPTSVESLPRARDPSALDVWFAGGRGGGEPDSGKFAVVIRNRSELARNIAVTVRRAAEVVSSLAFDREPESEVWRPILGSEGRVANWAQVSADSPQGALTLALPPSGAHDLYIEVAGEAETSEHAPADLQIELSYAGQTEVIATVRGAEAAPDDQWRWIAAGRIPELSDGGTLVLRALLPAGKDSARLQLGHVAWAAPDDPRWAPALEQAAKVEPFAQTTVDLEIPRSASAGAGVLWFEFYDAELRTHRALSYRVQIP